MILSTLEQLFPAGAFDGYSSELASLAGSGLVFLVVMHRLTLGAS